MSYHEKEMRLVYAQTLNELIDRDPNVFCLEADLSKASGTSPEVLSRHPQNFVNCGVQEANMIGVAAGMAREGRIPFCASFTAFATRRVYDQITVSVAYANNNVKIVGTSPGITQGPNGGTHMCFQDLAIMRAMPNMHVYSPADANELHAVLCDMAGRKQPTYLQLIRPKMPKLFDPDFRFDPHRASRLREGQDVTLVSTGFMTHIALEVAQGLSAEGVQVELLHYSAIKPFDAQSLIESARKTGAVVTVENQNVIGGLGGAVCEVLGEHHPVKIKRLGIPDRFGEVAEPDYLFDKHGFGPKQIAQACREMAGR
jgi:transketolase